MIKKLKLWRTKRRMLRALEALGFIARVMHMNGWSRQRQKAFWRDFEGHAESATVTINSLIKSLRDGK